MKTTLSSIPKKSPVLTEKQRACTIGFILGDAHLEKNGSHHRLRFDHAAREREYVLWKHRLLAPHVGLFRDSHVLDKRSIKPSRKCRFDSRTLPLFDTFYNEFYRGKEKIVPGHIGELLTSRWTLLTWFLDDGSRRTDSAALRLHTNSFSLAEVQLLRQALIHNWGIDCAIHSARARNDKRDSGYILHLGARAGAAERFCAIVKPLCAQECPTMLYKFL